MTGIHRTTLQKLLVDLGVACSNYQSRAFRNLQCKRIQCDEIWSFVGARQKIPRGAGPFHFLTLKLHHHPRWHVRGIPTPRDYAVS